jgi:hypothetical protein
MADPLQRRARALALGLLALLLPSAGCRSADVSDPADPAPASGDSTGVTPPPVPGPVDLDPPRFAGLQRIEWVQHGELELVWEPGLDDVTPTAGLRYDIWFSADPFAAPGEQTATVPLRTEPGVHRLRVRADTPGRYWVRAVDARDRTSPWGTALSQRAHRPWVSARDGRALSDIGECAELNPGRALCVGEGGFVGLWDRDHWEPLDLAADVTWRLAYGPGTLWLYSDRGHLHEWVAGEGVQRREVRFDVAPEPPFRTFTADPGGLLYWVDTGGRVWVGVPGDFRRMRRPLAMPEDEGCTELQALAFSETVGFAVCEDGSVWTANFARDVRWMSLTVQTPFAFEAGTVRAFASDDTGGTLVTASGVRNVGVGGWQAVVEAGRPMDAFARGAVVPGRLGQAVEADGQLTVASDVGLLEGPEGFLELVAGSQGDLAGFAAAPLGAPARSRLLFWRNGAVSRLHQGSQQWLLPPRLEGFVLGARTAAGLLGLQPEGVHRWTAEGWVPMAPAPPAMATTTFTLLTTDPAGTTVYLGGTREDATGVLLASRGGGAWTVEPMVERDREAEARNLQRTEQARLQAFTRAQSRGELPADAVLEPAPAELPVAGAGAAGWTGPVHDLAWGPEGGLLLTGDSVWWRRQGPWIRLWTASPDDAAALRAVDWQGPGLTWRLLRADGWWVCGQDACTPDPAGPSWVDHWREAGVLYGVGADLAVHLFRAPGREPDGPPAAFDPVGEPMPGPAGATPRRRFRTADGDWVWSTAGEFWLHQDGGWRLQGRRDDGLALLVEASTWSLLTPRALRTLADVPPALP